MLLNSFLFSEKPIPMNFNAKDFLIPTYNPTYTGYNIAKLERGFIMSLDKAEIADLNHEQLAALNVLEDKLGVTLVAYENASGSTNTVSNQ